MVLSSNHEHLLLAFVGDEMTAELFRITVDIDAELRQDWEPNIIGRQEEVEILFVSAYHGVNESVWIGDHEDFGYLVDGNRPSREGGTGNCIGEARTGELGLCVVLLGVFSSFLLL